MTRPLITILLCIVFASVSMAQNLQPINKTISFQPQLSTFSNAPEATTLNCVDTIEFTLAKATGLRILTLNNATSAQAASQYFNAAQAITISGATFYAFKSDATGGISANVPVSIYLAGADSLPTGAPLATVNVPVDTTFGGGSLAVLEKTANFTTPITMTQPYCVVIENNSPNGVGLVYNDYTSGDGRQQWLSGANIGGNWLNSYVISIGGAALDADVLVYPHVSYDLTSSFTSSRSYMCAAGVVTFTDNSSVILTDPMYNRAAFFNALAVSYAYDLGEGNPVTKVIDTTHTYTTPPPYTVIQYDTILGWNTFCAASDTTVLAPITLTTTTNTTVSNCDQATGTATVSPQLGVAPYTYQWDAAAANQTTATATNLAAGSYMATFTDSEGCIGSDTFVVDNPVSPTLGAAVSSNYNGADISCNGGADGTALATGTNGTTPYTYQWDAAAANQTTATAINLAAGTYGVTIIDAANCAATATVTLTEPTALVATGNAVTDVSCNGGTDGTTSTTVTGGTAPYSYLWSNSATTDTIVGLSAGSYIVTSTDANGCTVVGSTLTVNEPTLLTSTILDNGDGTATVSGAGGTPGYTYQWDAAAANQTTATATGLTNNTTYSVTVTDANGCTSVSNVTVTIVGINDLEVLNSLSVFPNPARTTVFVDLDMQVANDVSIRIVNVTGQTVLEKNLGNIQSERVELNTTELAKGVYMMNFNIGAEMTTTKLIIE
ncbi:T9SS type A sorting domain-containing protein [Aureispira sp. CCB-E]|uniref:T9SS type A sorting domain-containing protein n=1 Tax=Aureispira sp. CCB-E TaxID=3051121 RepID=UPI002869267C|nr:T9SS type A sorting domain-containing protein [Aureispira sp. CCB-E]WMX13840.1 T9SS type A sorting domain-containing protein [Aureispira sp. CCB-E]